MGLNFTFVPKMKLLVFSILEHLHLYNSPIQMQYCLIQNVCSFNLLQVFTIDSKDLGEQGVWKLH